MMCFFNKKNGGKLYVAISRRLFLFVIPPFPNKGEYFTYYSFFTYPTGISTVA